MITIGVPVSALRNTKQTGTVSTLDQARGQQQSYSARQIYRQNTSRASNVKRHILGRSAFLKRTAAADGIITFIWTTAQFRSVVPADTIQCCCSFFITGTKGEYWARSTLHFHTAQSDVDRSRYGTRYLVIYSGCLFFRCFHFSRRCPTSNALRMQHPFNTTIRTTIHSTE